VEPPAIKEIIIGVFSAKVAIKSDIAYPPSLLLNGERSCDGAEIFEHFFPELFSNVAGIVFDETFGKTSGTPRMQAVRIKTIMEKQYAPLQDILGEKRFQDVTDFQAKVDQWQEQGLPAEEIEERLVKSVASMYWSAARRDPRIFEQEIKGILLTPLKSLPSIGPRLDDGELTVADLAYAMNSALEKADLGRASAEVKELIHDLYVYAAIFYFLKKIEGSAAISTSNRPDRLGKIQDLREEVAQIVKKLLDLPAFRRIFYQALTPANI
jgi:hypothetical protein